MLKLRPSISILLLLLIICNISKAQYVFEKFDIYPGLVHGANPSNFVVVDTFLYFGADDGAHGIEPWICDGTQSGTQLIKDITTGKQSTTGAFMSSVNGKVAFLAGNSPNGYEPWITDGSANGTQMLKDIYSGPPSSLNTNRPYYYSTGTELYFSVNDGPHGIELWKTDGTTNGTVLVKDINPGTKGSQPAGFTKYKGKVYFIADDGSHGSELWVTDGTTNGTNIVIDMNAGLVHGYVRHLTVYNNKLYFAAYYNLQVCLMESDGTANGTKKVKEVNIVDSKVDAKSIVEYNGKLYFAGRDTSASDGVELWVSDGTAAGTNMVKDIYPSFGQSSNPDKLTVANNKLYFIADDGITKYGLWMTDGTANGTQIVTDANSNPLDITPYSILNYGNKLYFGLKEASYKYGLWVTDGTTTGTKVVKGSDTTFSFRGNFAVCNNSLYFGGTEYSYFSSDYELWKLTDTTLNSNPPTNIEATATRDITISPNPTSGKVLLSFDKVYEQGVIRVTDMSGKVLKVQQLTGERSLEMDLTALPAGMHIINLQHKDGNISQKLLLE